MKGRKNTENLDLRRRITLNRILGKKDMMMRTGFDCLKIKFNVDPETNLIEIRSIISEIRVKQADGWRD
jgi:hypothetical protein